MTSEQPAFVERHGLRGELVLNRPERKNALTGPLVEALQAGLDELIADEAIRVILIRGAGGAFCAGLDLNEFGAEPPPPWRPPFGGLWAAFHTAIYACPKPVVGALEGPAIAGGSALALACDMLIAGEGCRFQVAEVRFGMGGPVNAVWLQLKYRAATALELAAGAQPLNGPALVQRGVAISSVPDAGVLEEARAYADRLAENNPAAVASMKSTLRALNGVSVEQFAERIRTAQTAGQQLPGRPGAGLKG